MAPRGFHPRVSEQDQQQLRLEELLRKALAKDEQARNHLLEALQRGKGANSTRLVRYRTQMTANKTVQHQKVDHN